MTCSLNDNFGVLQGSVLDHLLLVVLDESLADADPQSSTQRGRHSVTNLNTIKIHECISVMISIFLPPPSKVSLIPLFSFLLLPFPPLTVPIKPFFSLFLPPPMEKYTPNVEIGFCLLLYL